HGAVLKNDRRRAGHTDLVAEVKLCPHRIVTAGIGDLAALLGHVHGLLLIISTPDRLILAERRRIGARPGERVVVYGYPQLVEARHVVMQLAAIGAVDVGKHGNFSLLLT